MKSLVLGLVDRLRRGNSRIDADLPEATFLDSAGMYQAIGSRTELDVRSGLSGLNFEGDGTLSPGVYRLTWSEFATYYGGISTRRSELLAGLERVQEMLKQSGCKRIFIGGSFVTAKLEPSDFDGCYVTDDMDLARLARLEPALLLDDPSDVEQLSQTYGGVVEPTRIIPSLNASMFEILQFDSRTRKLKGIVSIELSS